MKVKKTYILLVFGFLFSLQCFAQTHDFRQIEQELITSFKSNISYDTDSLAHVFTEDMLEKLSNPLTFENSLDSLAKLITIRTSPDKKIKFYSWDDITGGTWHNINCLAQFKAKNGKISVKQLNSGTEMELSGYTDSGVYGVYEFLIDNTTHYLTFASGTHGSGNHHHIIQIFRIKGKDLIKCENCFEDKRDLVIENSRSMTTKLKFDPATNEISYDQYVEPLTEHSVTRTIGYKLKNGVFVKQL